MKQNHFKIYKNHILTAINSIGPMNTLGIQRTLSNIGLNLSPDELSWRLTYLKNQGHLSIAGWSKDSGYIYETKPSLVEAMARLRKSLNWAA